MKLLSIVIRVISRRSCARFSTVTPAHYAPIFMPDPLEKRGS